MIRKISFVLLLLLATACMLPAQTAPAHYVDLKWTAPSDANATSIYTVYRAKTACTVTPLAMTALATTNAVVSYHDSAVTAATTYCYYVTQTLNGLESASSNTSQATTLPDPNPPSGLTTTAK